VHGALREPPKFLTPENYHTPRATFRDQQGANDRSGSKGDLGPPTWDTIAPPIADIAGLHAEVRSVPIATFRASKTSIGIGGASQLSRPRSTTSQTDFHPIIRPFSPLRLDRSYKLALEPDGSPLFTSTPLVACWRYEPREHLRPLAKSRSLIPPSPLRDRVGYSDHVRFRGYFPVHFIPAYNLPVYASQRPLPDATQDSVRGCSLGFAAAVIADGRLQRACKAQRSSNRTCSFPASGFPTGFITRHTSATPCARGSARARQGFHGSHAKTV